jgi:predicted DNA-binding transcriptional regulator YafY
MQRFDRILGILLFLRSQRSVTASRLARQFGVSTRTIYRDIETLSASGVPVYAERGHEGGFQLLEGYFLPPLMFARDEAISLLLALTLMRRLHTYPFPDAIAQAERKILAALPDALRSVLNEAEKIIGFEELPVDIFHPEPPSAIEVAPDQQGRDAENGIISAFLQAILENCTVSMHYHSPYREKDHVFPVAPQGLFWDRNH